MTSQNRIDANRRNALQSTGPRSASGKFRVRYNALWHGAFAADLLFPGEDPRAFASLRRRLRRFYQPANVEEEIIVNRILLAAWRLQRLAAMETRVLRSRAEAYASDVELRKSIGDMVRQRYLPDDEEPEDDEPSDSGPSDPIASAWNRDTGSGNTLVKLARYQFGLERALYRSIRQLNSRRGHPDIAPAT